MELEAASPPEKWVSAAPLATLPLLLGAHSCASRSPNRRPPPRRAGPPSSRPANAHRAPRHHCGHRGPLASGATSPALGPSGALRPGGGQGPGGTWAGGESLTSCGERVDLGSAGLCPFPPGFACAPACPLLGGAGGRWGGTGVGTACPSPWPHPRPSLRPQPSTLNPKAQSQPPPPSPHPAPHPHPSLLMGGEPACLLSSRVFTEP